MHGFETENRYVEDFNSKAFIYVYNPSAGTSYILLNAQRTK